MVWTALIYFYDSLNSFFAYHIFFGIRWFSMPSVEKMTSLTLKKYDFCENINTFNLCPVLLLH